MKSRGGQASPVCVCGKCFHEYAKPYLGTYLDNDQFSRVMLGFLAGYCPKGKLKRPKTELTVVKNT